MHVVAHILDKDTFYFVAGVSKAGSRGLRGLLEGNKVMFGLDPQNHVGSAGRLGQT